MSSENVAAVEKDAENLRFFKDDNGLYGLKDNDGNILMSGKYKNVGPFIKGFARVQSPENCKWGALSIALIETVPCIHNEVFHSDASEWGLKPGTIQFQIWNDNGYGYLNKDGEVFDFDEYFWKNNPMLRQIKRITDFVSGYTSKIIKRVR